MDPLTHTLVGANLASTSLGQKTRMAVPALIIGANLPDLDVMAYAVGGDFAIGFRRGWTHGVLALVVLPALLTAVLWLVDYLRRPETGAARFSPGWLFALTYLAMSTHPSLDWLNTYGMRWLMPFDDRWFYGDSVFIVDPWLWLVLGCSWLLIRKVSWRGSIVWLLPAAFLIFALRRSGPEFLPLLVGVFAVALLFHLWPPPTEPAHRRRIATTGLIAAGLFIGLLLSIHAATVERVAIELERLAIQPTDELMVGPKPTNPLVWDVVVGEGDHYRFGTFSWLAGSTLMLTETRLPAARVSDLWMELTASEQMEGYLGWIRFPWYEVEVREGQRLVHIMDARYRRTRSSGFGGAIVRLPVEPPGRTSPRED